MELPCSDASPAHPRFPDDRSDSGVSSLRSGSGDERSGSRSSALSSSDEPHANRSPLFDLGVNRVTVWRDPSLLVSEPAVRHINSVQHQTLLMSHFPGPPASSAPQQPPAGGVTQPPGHYVPPPPPLIHPHHLPPPGLYSQLPEMLWAKQRYPPLPSHLLQTHPGAEELLERERAYAQDRDRHERLLRERRDQEVRELEKQHKEQMKERERQDREKQMEREQERERLEKQRAAEQAVHKHFEESLRLAQQKRTSMCWNIINSLPPQSRGAANAEDERKRSEHDAHQQRLLAERLRQEARERAYYTQPTSVVRPGSKVEYPPPAHSRMGPTKPADKHPSGHTALPKAEPNLSLFGYPQYQPSMGHDTAKVKPELLKPKVELLLPNPPPLMSDVKNSVIVKNEGKAPPSPKLQQPHYLKGYEYRSPSQSPHHHLTPRHTPSPHHHEPQNLGKVHHRPQQHRQSPHHPAGATVGSYPYPSPPAHYPPPPATKPKVSSPAPPHIYGKPTAGISTGIPVCRAGEGGISALPLTSRAPMPPAVSPSPYQQLPLHHPPPAHSSRGDPRVMYDPRLYPKPMPPTSPPTARSPLQTQPLDLGVSDRRDDAASPKRKTESSPGVDPSKKRRLEQPQLARVGEPSPLMAGAATTITTMVNTAAYCTPPVTTSPAPPPGSPSPAKPPPSVDSDKSNSPGPATRPTNYPVHKLKKAWLQRHSGEDGSEDTTGVVGSGSCVTLPLTLPAPIPSKLPPVKEPTLNGHVDPKPPRADDSSSSDADAKSPPKRKPPKVKRKKGQGAQRKAAAEEKRKKLAAQSETGSDSDKESDKDSDSGGRKTASGVGVTGGGGSGSKEPRKRGRRPKSSKNERGEEPRQKRSRDDPPAPPPFRKPPVAQLKKTGEMFLQDGPCFEVAPKLAKCRECRWTPNQRSKNMPNIFCRFYAFRRLRYTKNGQLAIAGFSDPHTDPAEEDLKLWLPHPESPPEDLDLEMSRLLLLQVGDQLCDLLEQEKESKQLHMGDEKTVAWKRVVQGVREMCDVCETTLFNYHWACGKCGFVVCIDCYKSRKNGTYKMWGEPGRDRDDFSWLLCTNRSTHEQEKLMLTQIIAGSSLLNLGKKTHEVRALCNIPQFCGCPMSKTTNGICKDLVKVPPKVEPVNGIVKDVKEPEDSSDKEKNGTKAEDKNSPLSWLADVALGNEDKKSCDDSGSSSDWDDDKDDNYSTLRELLIRPSHKVGHNGSRSTSPANTPPTMSPDKKPRTIDTLDEVISSVIEHHKEGQGTKEVGPKLKPTLELKHYVRRYYWAQKGREPLPIRIMTLTESRNIYPDVPHSWLCDGKLLRLSDPNHSGNYRIFQDQWTRGQPVIVSDINKSLDMSLWHPDSFANDFGDEKNDLVNCMTGNLVPNQPMRKFWEGFEHFSRRLKDERGNPMLLKLKDWPPGEDFAEMLPSRFADLMRALPLGEYTQRSGRLNLAGRLPDCFVRPDLGPKMYNAYGSALHPTKGTTNLHLDISDAVNIMVYVGIPKDGDDDEHIKEAFRAIDEAGCDILTRRRVREKGELPGALWHIYHARDADKVRDLLNKVALERGARLEPHHDPIHDQSWYLDGPLRERLYKEYKVEGYAIVQCLGDSVFIPAGAPHQVRNLHNCIKVAEDFVSPENVSHCFHLTQEFRELSDTHSNHEDKLQIKNIIYHAVKDSLSVLTRNMPEQGGAEVAASTPAEAVKTEPASE